MSLVLRTNLASLAVQRHLAANEALLQRSVERLSSGLRINGAVDDPTGLVVADRLRADARLAAQALRNANDGISALAIGEQALGRVGDSLLRLSELAEESATGLVTDPERAALQTEYASLLAEIDRLAGGATFNGVALLAPGTTVTLQIGLDGTTSSQVTFDTVDGSTAGLGIAATAVDTQAGAQAVLPLLAAAVDAVALARGGFGAVESRLLHTVDSLRFTIEGFTAAESRIRDADVAAETANLTRATILRQAGVAVLAQANQLPAIVLELLR